MTWKGWLLRWHRRIGAIAVALVLLSAVTGAVLLFRASLFAHAKPRVEPVATPVTLEAIVAAGVAAGDGARATDVGLPGEPDEPWVVWLDDDAETEVYVDGRGRVVGRHAGIDGMGRVLFRLHTGEAIGETGRYLQLLVAVALCLLGLSGVVTLTTRWRARSRAQARRDGNGAGAAEGS
ncbi:MAG: PepSY domain-containing protein [Nannocystaceae bacterium]|nr:PepSY domain-containing protein [Nannocystaceae bacterium]